MKLKNTIKTSIHLFKIINKKESYFLFKIKKDIGWQPIIDIEKGIKAL